MDDLDGWRGKREPTLEVDGIYTLYHAHFRLLLTLHLCFLCFCFCHVIVAAHLSAQVPGVEVGRVV